ncbi:cytochrome P450 [Rhodococcus sp. 14-2470-1a]|uniref:cytochrome P450 n=1 Tax=Rhodococcus sp. 14-2470-1a TaxID=2023150 RepID=UPI000B9B83E4|nr:MULTISPECIES: cytochrome P450 [unclassified Rhodococcus (in: high G+C Gram-positive bacteria)]OZD59821.1 cytochrome P450 [Rhodococcus sp. 06-1059B-a]OZF56630.1 cytochrome P450 [Rhodococcus sp. 14-2470-1a]
MTQSPVTEAATFPLPRSCPFSSPDAYAELRENEPVSRSQLSVNGKTAWLITRHELVKKILADDRVSANLKLPGYPLQVPVPDEILQAVPLTFLSMDAPEHTVQRRMLAPEFSVRRMRALRPRIQEIVDRRIDAVMSAGSPADLVAHVAMPVPSLVICEMLGVPYADHARFEGWSAQTMSRDISDEERGLAHHNLDIYVDRLVTDKETEPGDDLISRLVERNREEPAVEHSDIASMSRLLLIAGHETTANMISLAVLTLLDRPDLRQALVADPDLVPKAVEELLRYWSISDSGTARVAKEDIEIGGAMIAAGEGILPLNNAANHDSAVFENPETIDFAREARSHLAFGYGIHQCIGQNLARLELDVTIRTILDRLPDLALAGSVDDLSFKHDAMVYGVDALPVTW